jgi:hypothetical protein
MSTLLRKKAARGLSLPGGMPRIDWSNPITAGLVGCWVPTGEGGSTPIIRDLVSQNVLLPTGAAVLTAGPVGLEAKGGVNIGWKGLLTPNQKPTNSFSCLYFGSVTATPAVGGYGFAPLFGCEYTSTWTAPYFSWGWYRTSNSSASAAIVSNDNASYIDFSVTTPPAVGALTSLLGSVTLGGPFTVYSNGKFLGKGSNTSAGSIGYTANSAVCVGTQNFASSGTNSGTGMCVGAIWNRSLTSGESALISADPTNFLIFPEDDLFSLLIGRSSIGSLTGSVSNASAVSGTLIGNGSLTGAALSVSSATGTLTGAGSLSGSAASTSSISGTLTGAGSLTGAASNASSTSGGLTGKGPLTGSAVSASTVSGTIESPAALIGSVSSASSASGFLSASGGALPIAVAAPASIARRSAKASQATRDATASISIRDARASTMSTNIPIRLEVMRQGTADTRGIDMTLPLSIESDTVNTISSITVARRDGLTITSSDLTCNPTGYAAAWIASNSANVAGKVPSWWQMAGPSIATGTTGVDYQITVTMMTVGGRTLVYDAYQMVTPSIG